MKVLKIHKSGGFILLTSIAFFLFAGAVFAKSLEENLIKDIRWRNIGPANISGRISDIEALDDDFTTVLVASASGGVWKSTNAGIAFEPIFDKYGSASIGDVAFFQKDPNIIWVGTGEKNSRNSVAWGDGIYKSTDGGKTFTNMGLRDTHTIGKVITHPTDPDIVYVAATGHTWGYSGDRGLFKTTDGGKTWQKLTNGLPDDGKTGAIDIVMHPENPDVLYVSFWQRLRQPYCFDSGGPNGGIFKTTNGGKSWQKLNKGLPEGDTGKIGLAISRSNPKVLMAIIEARESNDLSVPGSGVYRSEDNGETWKYVNTYNRRPYYYSHVYINPLDDQRVYVLTTRYMRSEDGGKTLTEAFGDLPQALHEDYHAMWFDPNNKDRYYIGTDGGCYLTHDHGNNNIYFDNFVIAQFYAIGVDMREPYWVYGGLQDSETWGGPSRSRDSDILNDHWFEIGPSSDGFHAQVDPTDWRTVYFEGQNGNIMRFNVETREWVRIRPTRYNIVNYDEYITAAIERQQEERGWDTAFRFNWSNPIVMSPHNPRTIFFGGNHLFKTLDRGDNWQIISPDLSKNDPAKTQRKSAHTENQGYASIITISESPIKPFLIWVGTDDGNVQLTRDGGVTWRNVRNSVPGVPDDLWVSRVEASHFEEGTAYLTFDGHRSDNFQPWVFKTIDYGQTWTNISNNIPDGHSVYVIKEDLKNPNLLFVGTEFAAFYSINGGRSWTKLNNNLPTVAIHDLIIHPRDGDLIAGTHGRGIWILDDITPLQQATEEVLAAGAHLFENRVVTRWLNIRRGAARYRGHFIFRGQNPPNNAIISYYLKSTPQTKVQLEISDISGYLKRTVILPGEAGINRYIWNMQFDPTPLQQGVFNLRNEIAEARSNEERQRVISSARSRLYNLVVNQREHEFLEQTLQQFASGGRGRRRGEVGQAQGFDAEPGEYIVKMTVSSQTYTSTITIRPDPILKEGK